MTHWHRVSKKVYIYNLVVAIRTIIVCISVYGGVSQFLHSHSLIVFLSKYLFILICLITLYKRAFEYFNTKYSLINQILVIKKGIFNVHTYTFHKKNVQKHIANIRVKSNVLHKFLQINELEISLQNGENEGTIIIPCIKHSHANMIQQWFNSVEEFTDEEVDKESISFKNYTVPVKQILISSLLSSNYLFLIPICLELQEWTNRLNIKLNDLLVRFNDLYITIPLLFVILFLYSFFRQYMLFGNFLMRQDNKNFYVKNGFFNDDTNIIEKSKIKGIIIEQSLGMRLLGLSTIAVTTINNGELHSTHSKNYLFPFVKNQEVEQYLNSYFSSYLMLENYAHRKRKLLCFNFLQLIITFSILAAICVEITRLVDLSIYFVFLLVLFISPSPLFKKITTRLGLHHTGIQTRTGILNVKIYLVLNEHIECINVSTYKVRSKVLSQDLKIVFRSTPVKRIRVSGLPIGVIKNIEKRIFNLKNLTYFLKKTHY